MWVRQKVSQASSERRGQSARRGKPKTSGRKEPKDPHGQGAEPKTNSYAEGGKENPTFCNSKPRSEGWKTQAGSNGAQGPPSKLLPNPGSPGLASGPGGESTSKAPASQEKPGRPKKQEENGPTGQILELQLEEQTRMPSSPPRKGQTPKPPEIQKPLNHAPTPKPSEA
ncbi:basic salivary proline-rich protein 3-like [Procambarus clarkii]|uniref:basic salivary proline-rich protein 3-like n=1 Tax=Procambarus clarkii TaxID=6728 RepID=UPI003742E7FE